VPVSLRHGARCRTVEARWLPGRHCSPGAHGGRRLHGTARGQRRRAGPWHAVGRRPRARDHPPAQPRRVRQHGARPARHGPAARRRLPHGRPRVRVRQPRRHPHDLSAAARAVRARGGAPGGRRAHGRGALGARSLRGRGGRGHGGGRERRRVEPVLERRRDRHPDPRERRHLPRQGARVAAGRGPRRRAAVDHGRRGDVRPVRRHRHRGHAADPRARDRARRRDDVVHGVVPQRLLRRRDGRRSQPPGRLDRGRGPDRRDRRQPAARGPRDLRARDRGRRVRARHRRELRAQSLPPAARGDRDRRPGRALRPRDLPGGRRDRRPQADRARGADLTALPVPGRDRPGPDLPCGPPARRVRARLAAVVLPVEQHARRRAARARGLGRPARGRRPRGPGRAHAGRPAERGARRELRRPVAVRRAPSRTSSADYTAFPTFDEPLREAMRRETKLFLRSSLQEGGASLEDAARQLHLRERPPRRALRASTASVRARAREGPLPGAAKRGGLLKQGGGSPSPATRRAPRP
jgi:hypothetical protein